MSEVEETPATPANEELTGNPGTLVDAEKYFDPENPRNISGQRFGALHQSIDKFGDLSCIVYNRRQRMLVGGHQRIRAMLYKYHDAPITITREYEPATAKGTIAIGYIELGGEYFKYRMVDWDEDTHRAANVAANNITGEFNDSLSEYIYKTAEAARGYMGFAQDELARLMEMAGANGEGGSGDGGGVAGSLAERFIAPPFSILDTRQGYWQDRKRAWLDMGIKSEVGRDSKLTYGADDRGDFVGGKIGDAGGSTSVFDPVLCEIIYKWFAPPAANILDPFAGGSVRGIVANEGGHNYTGIELRSEQVEANYINARIVYGVTDPAVQPIPAVQWIPGDSAKMGGLLPEGSMYDLVFSCPPYADLEVYSDDQADISNMEWTDFLEAYRGIILQSVKKLRDNRFAIFVVGEVRDKKGMYRNFVGETIRAFLDAGMGLYNDAILVNAIGTLPLRVGKQFATNRKLGKVHQNVLVFYKGDPAAIKAEFPQLALADLMEEEPEDGDVE